MVNKFTTQPTIKEVVPKINEVIDALGSSGGGISITDVLNAIYPVGSIYISTNSTCPIANYVGTWTLVASNKALWTGDGTNGGTTIAQGLPNIVGITHFNAMAGGSGANMTNDMFSAFASSYATQNSKASGGGSTQTLNTIYLNFYASAHNSVYSDDVSTVQPPAYVVNVWKRTA